MKKERVTMMQRKKISSLISFLTAIAASLFISLTVNAADTADPPAELVLDKKITITSQDDIPCKKHRISLPSGGSSTANTIRVSNGKHTIYLNAVTIEQGSAVENDCAPIEILGGAEVELILEGTNTLKGRDGFAGLYVDDKSSVTISSKDGTVDNRLIATGGKSGAGIGGQSAASPGKITIKSGEIEATGGIMAAGIGCGREGVCGSIDIQGGKIKATGGAGEDFRPNPDSEHTVNISGGAGIGCGGGSQRGQKEVIISGGDITAMGGRDTKGTQHSGIDCYELSSKSGGANIVTNQIDKDTETANFAGIVWNSLKGTKPRIGTVYKNAVLNQDIADGEYLQLRKGSSLVIPVGKSENDLIYNYGSITGSGENSIINAARLKNLGYIDGNIPQKVILIESDIIDDPDNPPKYTYTGKDQTKNILSINQIRNINGVNCEVDAYDWDKSGWQREIMRGGTKEEQILKAGKYTIDYTNPNYPTESFQLAIEVEQKTIEPGMVEDIGSVDYNGGDSCEPKVKITFNGEDVSEEFIVTYQNNTEVTKDEPAVAIITAKDSGNFYGEVKKEFTIKPASLEGKEVITIDPVSIVYNGEEQEPKITVSLNGKNLVNETDYSIENEPNDLISAGTITYRVRGKGNYEGLSEAVEFIIEPKTIHIASDSKVTAESKSYDGNSIVQLSGVKFRDSDIVKDDKGKVELTTGIIDDAKSPNIGEYRKIKFDSTTPLTGASAGNYILADGETITLDTPVEIKKLVPDKIDPEVSSYGVSKVEGQTNKYECIVSIDKQAGISYMFVMDGEIQIEGIDDPEDTKKVRVKIPFDNITPETTHTFTVHSVGNDNVEAIEIGSVTKNFEKLPRDPKDVPPDPVPEVTPNADRKSFDITIPKMLDENGKEIPAEYRFDGPDGEGEWGSSNVKMNCAPLSEYTCYIRYLPTEVYGPSEPGKATVKTEAAPASTDGPKYNYTLTPINPDNPDDSILSAGILENVGGTDAVTAALNAALAVMDGYNWDDIKYYDLTIMVKYYDEAGVQQERPATAADFDANGGVLPVTIKSNNLPSGTNVKKNDFAIAHMFSEDYGGHTTGEVETWENEQSQPLQKTGTGLTFNISGTSPIAIAWKAATNPDDPGTDDPNNPGNDDPNNPGTDDPNNPGTDDPNNPGTDDPNNPGGTDPTNPDGNNGDGSNANPNAANGTDANAANANGTGTNDDGTKSAAQSAVDALKSAAASLLPKTGDTSKIIMWAVIAVAAVIAVVAVIRSKAKKAKKGKAKASSSAQASATAKKSAASTAKKSTATTAKKTTTTTVKKASTDTAKKTTTTKKSR